MGSNDEQSDIDMLYEFGERLNEAKDKSAVRTDSLSLSLGVRCIVRVSGGWW